MYFILKKRNYPEQERQDTNEVYTKLVPTLIEIIRKHCPCILNGTKRATSQPEKSLSRTTTRYFCPYIFSIIKYG